STNRLDEANAFLSAVLTALRAGVAVVDRDMRIQVWNHRAEDLWGLRPSEAVGQHLLNLDIGLPTDQLRPMIKASLPDSGRTRHVDVDAINRRGRSIRLRIECSPLASTAGVVSGAVLVMETNDEVAELGGRVPAGPDGAAVPERVDDHRTGS